MQIKIMQKVLEANDKKADEIRRRLNEKNILMLNLISSPGSGKTTLLEKTLPILKDRYRMAIIEGDVETDRDARRLDQFGVPVALINTQGACHLESVSIEKALVSFDLDSLDLIFVENVGNLVCPAEFDIGEHHKVALLSVPEGDDKVVKYPLLFREASLVLLTKIDLLSYSPFDVAEFSKDLGSVNPAISGIKISCQNNLGLDEWIAWVDKSVKLRGNTVLLNKSLTS